ncbi:MAG TPA: DUF2721 domain-containing protein [Fibrobacteria bacterium]|nr:DUF2721 domain-containing protein [Fibrobacteria bacterium]
MEITLTTPSLLFPAITLLLLAYTNRFLGLASLVRDLYSKYKVSREELLYRQIKNLRRRLRLIRNMQAFGIASLLLTVLCTFVLFAGQELAGRLIFGASLLLMMASLGISLLEIVISTEALNLQLSDLEEKPGGA